jgi:hypothetical protein
MESQGDGAGDYFGCPARAALKDYSSNVAGNSPATLLFWRICAILPQLSVTDAPGHLHMIDLSPQPQDKSQGAAELNPGPTHDAIPGRSGEKTARDNSWRQLSHESAEAGVQWLSRWAGPAALIIALGAIGWFFFA